MATSLNEQLSPTISTTSSLVEAIRLAEITERSDDMTKLIHLLVQQKSAKSEPLTRDERDLFVNAYKYSVSSKRSAWITLNDGFDDADPDLIAKYKRDFVEKEVLTLCREVIDLVTNHLYPTVKGKDSETEVLYLKILGDYHRYLGEITPTDELKEGCLRSYQQAMTLAESSLSVTHPTRLGLALNFSVAHTELCQDPQSAVEMAQKAFDAAIEDLDNLDQSSYRDSTMIMQLLRDNITLWTELIEQANDPNFKRRDDVDFNDGIDITKYAKYVKAEKHDPNNAQDMHDLKADMQRLGLMAQNTEDPQSERDKLRLGLVAVFEEITNEEVYKEIIHLILEYEAFIDLSKFKCTACNNYFGCDEFENLCSECFEDEYSVEERKRRCTERMQTIAVRYEWRAPQCIYYSIISMPSMCSMKIMFRILNRNKFRCDALWTKDENDKPLFKAEMCDRFMKEDEEPSDEVKETMKRNERCITDFGVFAMSKMRKC